LFPWTLLVLAAARRAWRQRRTPQRDNRAVRFAIAASLPPLVVLSLAATARNIYFAPALPGIALLIAWWAREILPGPEPWDVRALRATAALLLLGVAVFAAALALVGADSWNSIPRQGVFVAISAAGLLMAAFFAARAWSVAGGHALHCQWSLLLAYCALLIGPASQAYRPVNTWQNLAKIGRAVEHGAAGSRLILLAPDETTRAFIDMYARTSVDRIAGPLDAADIERVRAAAAAATSDSLFLVQLAKQPPPGLPWRGKPPEPALPPWIAAADLAPIEIYSAPYGRRYALLRVRR
jgi:4-amino-4-deoxy-L-arabinose transferase-like glycosyltransferase